MIIRQEIHYRLLQGVRYKNSERRGNRLSEGRHLVSQGAGAATQYTSKTRGVKANTAW